MSTFISSEKHTKSDVWKTWKGIFIDYTRTSKHLRVWAPRTYQVLIASEPVVNKSKRGANLLMEHPLPPPEKPLRPQTGEPKPRSRFQKNALEKRLAAKQSLIEGNKLGKRAHAKDVASENDIEEKVVQAIIQTKQIKIDLFHNPKPGTDLDGTSGKNPLGDRLVRPTRKFAKSVTKTTSKVREPKTYNEAINDPIHGNRWHKAVNEELWNLDAHQT
ncbi:hypothetical protein MMC31_006078 [Peltigera leucophlebia]|nr:hypothetical protein [Peltigera leucophlebia]